MQRKVMFRGFSRFFGWFSFRDPVFRPAYIFLRIQFRYPALEPFDFLLIFLDIGNQVFYNVRLQWDAGLGIIDALLPDFPIEAIYLLLDRKSVV